MVGSVLYVVDAHVGVAATNALKAGSHTLTALPFTGTGSAGTAGASKQLRLFVVRSFNAAAQFSASHNPGGAWRYGLEHAELVADPLQQQHTAFERGQLGRIIDRRGPERDL